MPTLKKNTLVLWLTTSLISLVTFQVQAQSIANYLRLKENAAGSNEVTLKTAPNTAAYNLFLPSAAPSVGSLLAITSLTGTDATFAFTAPSAFSWSLTGNSGTSATTNFIGTTDNIPLRFFTNNAERMRILGSGNVGIGTASPANALDVIGNFSIKSATSPSASVYGMELFTNSNSPRLDWIFAGNYIGQLSSDATNFYLRNSVNDIGNIRLTTKTGSTTFERLTVLNNGNVGMGTATPTAQLHVKGNAGGIILERTAGTAPYDQGFLKIINKDGGAFQMRSSSGANDGFNITNGDALKTYITGLTSGNIGIGTTSPANKLEITQGTAGNSGLRFTNLTSASAATTSSSKVLALNSTGDVILTNVPGTQNIVEFAVNTNPNTTGTTFTPNTPSDETVIYQSTIDNSLWTYNGTTYVTYTAPPSTPFYLTGGTNDAGSNKTANIYRTGGISAGSQTIYGNITANGGTAFTGAPPYGTASIGKITHTTSGWNGTGFLFGNTTSGSSSFSMVYNSDKAFFGQLGASLITYGSWNSTGFLLGSDASAVNRLDVIGRAAIGSYAGVNAAPANGLIVSGNVGIGTAAPVSKLEVNGSATNTTAFNSGTATAILFNNSNLAYTTASPTSFSLQGMKDGGTYTLAVQGTTSGTSTFIGLNPAGQSFTFMYINNGPTIAGKHTLYTFIVMGTTVYVYMSTGFST